MGLKHIFSYASLTASAIAYHGAAPITHKDATNSKRESQGNTAMLYSFDDIGATLDIYWQPCFDTYNCTKLLVPLDYHDPRQGYTSISYIRYGSVDFSGQDIMYNPGGPGGSGIDSLRESREEFEGIFGTEYNFISFDPRGVGATGPKLSCGDHAVQFSPTAPLGEKWAQSEANGINCTDNAPFTYKYVGTVANVRDMIYFTQLQAKAKGEDPEQAQIWYYGISYGTVIGQTLAALYPERLGRVILDGNVDSTEHYTGFAPSAVLDTDKAFEFFFDYCAQAGEEFCPLANKSSTASDVQDRYDALLNRLEYQPYILRDSTTIIKRDTINSWGYNAMYGPSGRFYDFAVQVAKVENKTLSEADLGGGDSDSSDDSLQIITCVDTAGRYALKSLKDYEKGVDLMRNRSYYGYLDIASSNALVCNGMGIMPPQSQIFPGFSVTNTSVPILFINTSGDPITPLASAKKMAGYFPGSTVLTVRAPGHSYSQTKSECANNHVRNYMKDATLPKEGEICEDTLTPITIFNNTQTPTSTDVPEVPNIPTPTAAVKRLEKSLLF